MVILGVDPSLKATGYGVIEKADRQVRLIEAGTIEPKSKEPIQNRLNVIYSNLEAVVQEYRPDVLVLEKAYTHHRYHTTGIILGHARGVICLLAARQNIQFEEYSVKRVRKSVTGNGNASKSQTMRFVAKMLGINEQKLTLDASDALAMALGYVHMSDAVEV